MKAIFVFPKFRKFDVTFFPFFGIKPSFHVLTADVLLKTTRLLSPPNNIRMAPPMAVKQMKVMHSVSIDQADTTERPVWTGNASAMTDVHRKHNRSSNPFRKEPSPK